MGCAASVARKQYPADENRPAGENRPAVEKRVVDLAKTSEPTETYIVSDHPKTISIRGFIAAEQEAHAAAFRARLVSLGNTFSFEVAPGDVGSEDKPAAKVLSLSDLQREATLSNKAPPVAAGTLVFVNMVKATLAHFEEVAAASEVVARAGLAPVPHLPAARFETPEELRSILSLLTAAGSKQMLVLGGNDLGDRRQAGACCYPDGAGQMLAAEIVAFKESKVSAIALAGHPDGHPALNWDADGTVALLVEKARPLLDAGFDVMLATQFCFDARKLIIWLERTRRALGKLLVEWPGRKVTFHIGVPGPTPRKKLERIAKICEVPSLFISSAFDILDGDGDGLVSLEELAMAVEMLGMARKGSKLMSMYTRHAGADGLLSRDEFAELLVEDSMEARMKSKQVGHIEFPASRAVVTPTAKGPSVHVGGADKDDEPAPQQPRAVSIPAVVTAVDDAGMANSKGKQAGEPEVIWPEEMVLALAAFCERERLPEGEVVLHFYPFGGMARTFELTSMLKEGTWPHLTSDP